MNIDATLTKIATAWSGPLAQINQSVGQSKLISGGPDCGPLTQQDLNLLRKARGWDFDWPPKEGSGFPLAAVQLGALREAQAAEGVRAFELKASDIAALGKSGQLDPTFVSKALAYLNSKGDTSASDSEQTLPTNDTITTNGSRYL